MSRKFFRITVPLAATLVVLSGCAHIIDRTYRPAPATIPDTTAQMRSPDYWISLNSCPDKVVMAPSEIESFNRRVKEIPDLIHDVARIGPEFSGAELKKRISGQISSLKKRYFYRSSGKGAGSKYYRLMADSCGIDKIPDTVKVKYAIVAKTTDQRVLPADEGLFARYGDKDFDELQNSGLDIGEPAAVLCESADGLWRYVITRLSEGWVKEVTLAYCSAEDIAGFEKSEPRAVVVSAKAVIFSGKDLKYPVGNIRMGVSLPVADPAGDRYLGVTIPVRDEMGALKTMTAYIERAGANIGYLPYTPRAIIGQAFRLLDRPYGWGDINADGDCSRFIQEIFATVGIFLPRNSGAQGKVGRLLWGGLPVRSVDKEKVIVDEGIGGITTLQLKGHIMLYLGAVNGKPYAIHAFWAYGEPGLFKDKVRVVRRVAVTGLDLGKGSRKGSLLKRIVSVRALTDGS